MRRRDLLGRRGRDAEAARSVEEDLGAAGALASLFARPRQSLSFASRAQWRPV